MRIEKQLAPLAWSMLMLFACSSALAAELTLDAAKQQGLVGEQHDGYLGLVTAGTPAEARALVEEVNARRRAEYQRIADANGIALADVEALAGKKALQRTAPGHFVRLPGEDWRRK